ncbi:glutathione S-transferase N-terminal domain-containing protein [Sandaracinobacteroides saxicola]|uniref:Glutathione S-transferase N-terminal domain-containing protein n=1 Tax=Sandaracinobacteroides saxicola TaxID=2759707 RepID=A0A7G5II50_9SPHN|nr:glutathione S-transferase N-terminal domain-containing protein [Sandaracinobacteroides saxicola]QMW23042.1 glutathione S-transferase N-terminal domain-containing protein [Sandaracinobacteroides saxicola]
MKLIIGNKAYSSWSLRGWLAAKQSGLPFEEEVVSMYDAAWATRRETADFAPSGGKVPILWDGDVAAWNALGIIHHLDAKTGGTRFWPVDAAARAFAASIAAEMQASFAALRTHCSMNVRRHYSGWALHADAVADVARVDALWREGLARFGGPWLAGADYGAADILFAPVASRFTTYDVRLSPAAEAYRARAMAHPWVAEWVAEAHKEAWVLDQYEY